MIAWEIFSLIQQSTANFYETGLIEALIMA